MSKSRSLLPADLTAAADSLHRAHLIFRVAGRLPEPAPLANRSPWMFWLNGAEAREQGQRVATAHQLASRGHFLELANATSDVPTTADAPIDVGLLLDWLASTPHPRPLARWVSRVRDAGELRPAETVVAVALAAFSFPRQEAVNFWFYLCWRAGWQKEIWPDPRDFLVASGPVLPALRRRILRRPALFSTQRRIR
ncbi:MAG: hypothetical protein ACKO2G_03910 [Verrucomicrobiales bacterium]